MYLQLIFQNNSNVPFTVIFLIIQNFAIKLNANAFKLQVTELTIEQIPVLPPGQACQIKIKLDSQNSYAPLDGWPYTIDCGLKATQG